MASKKDNPVVAVETESINANDLDFELDMESIELAIEGAMRDILQKPSTGLELSSPDDDVALGVHVSTPTELSALESLITEVDDDVEYLTWVIYGKNGTGKTTMLSTTDGMLILASEDGTLSIKDKAKGKAKKLRIEHWEQFEAVYWLLKGGKATPDGIIINTSTGPFLVKTVAIDTVTKLVEVAMRSTVLGARAKDPTQDVIKKTLKNWGDNSDKVKYWMQMFSELPVQNVWLFQESSNSESSDSDEYSIFPAVNNSVRLYCLAEADIIARTLIVKKDDKNIFALSTKPNASYVTKDRTNHIGVMANPSLDKIYAKVFGTTTL